VKIVCGFFEPVNRFRAVVIRK